MYEITANDNVLFIDDEENILKSIKRSLLDVKFQVITTTKPDEAVEIMAAKRINVLVTDLKMPGMNGIDLIRYVSSKYPYVSIIVLSAYYQVSTVLSVIRSGEVYYYFTKPLKMEDGFIDIIEKAIRHSKDRAENIFEQERREVEMERLRDKITELSEANRNLDNINRTNLAVSRFALEGVGRMLKLLMPLTADKKAAGVASELSLVRDEGINILKTVNSMIKEQI